MSAAPLGYAVVHLPGACDEGTYVEGGEVLSRETAERRVAAKGAGDCGFVACALVPVADLPECAS